MAAHAAVKVFASRGRHRPSPRSRSHPEASEIAPTQPLQRMVTTRSGQRTTARFPPPADSRMQRARRAPAADGQGAAEPAPPARRSAAAAALSAAAAPPPPASPEARQRGVFVQLVCYTCWFALLWAGTVAYEGEPVLVKSKDLPLHWFDKLFRATGALLLFALWAARAGAALLAPGCFDRRVALVWQPAAIYLAQSAVRMLIYQLHVAGLIFSPQRFARDNQSHPPHVMSDHILLGSAVHAGLASEAALCLLTWDAAAAAGCGATLLLRAYSALAAILAILVSAECYFTARYFHPPGEIVLAAVLGAALFQFPLLAYARWAFDRSHAVQQAGGAGQAKTAAKARGDGERQAVAAAVQ